MWRGGSSPAGRLSLIIIITQQFLAPSVSTGREASVPIYSRSASRPESHWSGTGSDKAVQQHTNRTWRFAVFTLVSRRQQTWSQTHLETHLQTPVWPWVWFCSFNTETCSVFSRTSGQTLRLWEKPLHGPQLLMRRVGFYCGGDHQQHFHISLLRLHIWRHKHKCDLTQTL